MPPEYPLAWDLGGVCQALVVGSRSDEMAKHLLKGSQRSASTSGMGSGLRTSRCSCSWLLAFGQDLVEHAALVGD
jgi:hypothetical protein